MSNSLSLPGMDLREQLSELLATSLCSCGGWPAVGRSVCSWPRVSGQTLSWPSQVTAQTPACRASPPCAHAFWPCSCWPRCYPASSRGAATPNRESRYLTIPAKVVILFLFPWFYQAFCAFQEGFQCQRKNKCRMKIY